MSLEGNLSSLGIMSSVKKEKKKKGINNQCCTANFITFNEVNYDYWSLISIIVSLYMGCDYH